MKSDEQVAVSFHSEGMRSLSRKILKIMPKFKKKKKSFRRKKTLKKTEKSSLTGTCSHFSTTVRSSNLNVPKSAANTRSSSGRTMALSYRDVLQNRNTPVMNAECKDGSNVNEIYKSMRYDIETPYGKWINTGWLDERATKGTRIKVLSYNILAQCLLESHRYLYHYSENQYLDWEYRSQALIREFAEFDADILCLQEVEATKLFFFDEELARLGYKGEFKKRTGDKEDGCAIYFREDKFDLKELVPVEFFQPGVLVLNRDNIGLIAVLQPKDNPSKKIVIATTHLLFNPKRVDVKLAQTQIMLAEIERVAFKCRKNRENIYHPIILTGDFNSRPYSSVYSLVMNGRVNLTSENPVPYHLGVSSNCQHRDVISHRYPECREDADLKRVQLYNTENERQPQLTQEQHLPRELNWRRRDNILSHSLNLNCVHPQNTQKGEDASTYQDGWCTVDYIFYGPAKFQCGEKTDGDIKLVSYMRLPSQQEAETLRAIPSELCASDHLPLLATFHLPTQV